MYNIWLMTFVTLDMSRSIKKGGGDWELPGAWLSGRLRVTWHQLLQCEARLMVLHCLASGQHLTASYTKQLRQCLDISIPSEISCPASVVVAGICGTGETSSISRIFERVNAMWGFRIGEMRIKSPQKFGHQLSIWIGQSLWWQTRGGNEEEGEEFISQFQLIF